MKRRSIYKIVLLFLILLCLTHGYEAANCSDRRDEENHPLLRSNKERAAREKEMDLADAEKRQETGAYAAIAGQAERAQISVPIITYAEIQKRDDPEKLFEAIQAAIDEKRNKRSKEGPLESSATLEYSTYEIKTGRNFSLFELYRLIDRYMFEQEYYGDCLKKNDAKSGCWAQWRSANLEEKCCEVSKAGGRLILQGTAVALGIGAANAAESLLISSAGDFLKIIPKNSGLSIAFIVNAVAGSAPAFARQLVTRADAIYLWFIEKTLARIEYRKRKNKFIAKVYDEFRQDNPGMPLPDEQPVFEDEEKPLEINDLVFNYNSTSYVGAKILLGCSSCLHATLPLYLLYLNLSENQNISEIEWQTFLGLAGSSLAITYFERYWECGSLGIDSIFRHYYFATDTETNLSRKDLKNNLAMFIKEIYSAKSPQINEIYESFFSQPDLELNKNEAHNPKEPEVKGNCENGSPSQDIKPQFYNVKFAGLFTKPILEGVKDPEARAVLIKGRRDKNIKPSLPGDVIDRTSLILMATAAYTRYATYEYLLHDIFSKLGEHMNEDLGYGVTPAKICSNSIALEDALFRSITEYTLQKRYLKEFLDSINPRNWYLAHYARSGQYGEFLNPLKWLKQGGIGYTLLNAGLFAMPALVFGLDAFDHYDWVSKCLLLAPACILEIGFYHSSFLTQFNKNTTTIGLVWAKSKNIAKNCYSRIKNWFCSSAAVEENDDDVTVRLEEGEKQEAVEKNLSRSAHPERIDLVTKRAILYDLAEKAEVFLDKADDSLIQQLFYDIFIKPNSSDLNFGPAEGTSSHSNRRQQPVLQDNHDEDYQKNGEKEMEEKEKGKEKEKEYH